MGRAEQGDGDAYWNPWFLVDGRDMSCCVGPPEPRRYLERLLPTSPLCVVVHAMTHRSADD